MQRWVKLVHERGQNKTHLDENLDVNHFQGKVAQKGKGMKAQPDFYFCCTLPFKNIDPGARLLGIETEFYHFTSCCLTLGKLLSHSVLRAIGDLSIVCLIM